MAHGLPAEGGRFTIAAVAFGNPAGRLRRHSLGGADLPPVDPSSRSHPAATEAVATGRSHALRSEGAEATAALSNTTGRLRRETPGGADLPPVDPSSRSHHAATEAVATGRSHALRAVRRFDECRGHNISRQHHRAASPAFARQSRSPTSGPKLQESSRCHRGCCYW